MVRTSARIIQFLNRNVGYVPQSPLLLHYNYKNRERLQEEKPNMAATAAVIRDRVISSKFGGGAGKSGVWLRTLTCVARCRCVPEINVWNSRGAGLRRGGWGAGGTVGGRDDGKELTELRHQLCLASRREHVMG